MAWLNESGAFVASMTERGMHPFRKVLVATALMAVAGCAYVTSDWLKESADQKLKPWPKFSPGSAL